MDANANVKYKDSVFTLLFSDPGKMLALYNALSGSDMPDSAQVEVATLADVLFMKQINDLAFIVESKVVILVEHQSTICGNAPLRLLLYIARVYEKIINIADKKAVFRSKLMKVPRPDFYVLYNGAEDYPERKTLRLSDAFAESGTAAAGGFLELEVTVLNINEGKNSDMVRRCEDLSGYVTFVSKVREHQKDGCDLQNAITKAIEYCVSHGVLAKFLEAHASEVRNMITTEFDLATALEVRGEESREEGRVEGIQTVARKLLGSGMPTEKVMDFTGLAREDVDKLRAGATEESNGA